MDESVHVPEEDWAREIERIKSTPRRALRFVASPPPGVGKKAGLMLGLGALTGNLNVGAHAGTLIGSSMKDDIGGNVIRPDRCCLCGLNPATKTYVLNTKIENLAGMLLGGPLLGEQTVSTSIGYCTSCEVHVKDLPGINLAEYVKVGGAWTLTLTFQNDRVAREYYRLNVDRVLDPLHAATSVGDVEAVVSLLDAGTPVDVRNAKGTTPLHAAAEFGNTEMMDLLIGRGADVDAVTPGGIAPLHMAALQGGPRVAEQLLAAGAHVDPAASRGITPLHIACETGRGDVAEVLLAHGADPNALSDKKRTPAMFGAPHPEILELLRRHAEGGAARLASGSGTPAGWHPDPLGRHEYRYWDGSEWTDHVSDGGEQRLDPMEASTDLS